MTRKWSEIRRNSRAVADGEGNETAKTDLTVEYPIELMVEFAARDVLVPAEEISTFTFTGHVFDLASPIADSFNEIHSELVEHGRALEPDEKPI
jgi:hypothetical protein